MPNLRRDIYGKYSASIGKNLFLAPVTELFRRIFSFIHGPLPVSSSGGPGAAGPGRSWFSVIETLNDSAIHLCAKDQLDAPHNGLIIVCNECKSVSGLCRAAWTADPVGVRICLFFPKRCFLNWLPGLA